MIWIPGASRKGIRGPFVSNDIIVLLLVVMRNLAGCGVIGEIDFFDCGSLCDADNLKRLLYVSPHKRARFKTCAKCGFLLSF